MGGKKNFFRLNPTLIEEPPIEINQDTRIFMYFDASGSMPLTLTRLNEAKDTTIKALLLPHYNNDEVLYNQMVTIENFPLTGEPVSSYERFIMCLNLKGEALPFGNVIALVFTDEATNKYHTNTFVPTDSRTAAYDTDINAIRARLTSFLDGNFYRGAVYQVMSGYVDSARFPQFLDAITLGQGNFAPPYGISDLPQIVVERNITYNESVQYYTDIIEQTLIDFNFDL